MFVAVGLPLEWCQRATACRDWDERIVVTLEPTAPSRLSRWALAEARAFEGRTIWLYLDRVPATAPELIAHVLVHETTHLLQACDYHADSGVMKAPWDDRDHAAMKARQPTIQTGFAPVCGSTETWLVRGCRPPEGWRGLRGVGFCWVLWAGPGKACDYATIVDCAVM